MTLSVTLRMVVIVTNNLSNIKELKNFLSFKGLKFRIFPIEGFKKSLKDDVDLIIYDTYNLCHKDLENIHLAKDVDIPTILITDYPEKWATEEISKLWRHNIIMDYLIRPVRIENLATYLPICKPN